MFDDLFSWLLLPACGALGWAMAKRSGPGAGLASDGAPGGRADAIGRLGVLIRDDADEAVNALTKAIEAEPAAVELHLMLGSLFRKRGEIDRAIRVHETLLDSPELSVEQAGQARLELARDYLKAGVIDRAESLAQSLLDSAALAPDALELLLDLYEQTRDWQQAIGAASRWQAVRGRSAATRIAHYHCEIAEAARNSGDTDAALAECQKALTIDRSCVRASILQGGVLEKLGNAPQALLAYARILEQNPHFLPEVLAPLQRCAGAAGEQRGLGQLFEEAEKRKDVPMAVLQAKAQWLAAQGEPGSSNAAAAYLAAQLGSRPDWQGLLQWMELSGASAAAGEAWPAMKAALQKRLATQSGYFCSHCGFKTSVLFWQCPSCRTWATIRPAA